MLETTLDSLFADDFELEALEAANPQETALSIPIELLDLHDAQQVVVESMARFRVCIAGRRWGKTEVAIDEITNALLDGKSVAYFTPTYKMGKNVWRLLVQILAPITTYKNETDRRLVTITGGILECWSMEKPDLARGRKYHLVILDEAAYIKDETAWQSVIRPLLTDYIGRCLFLSTPRGKGWLYHLYLQGQDPLKPNWASWRFPTSSNPYITPQEIEEARQELTAVLFEQEYEAKFGDTAGQVFRNIDRVAVLNPVNPYRGKFSMGIDWAQSDDFTVLKVIDIETGQEVYSDRFNRLRWSMQRDRVKAANDLWRPVVIVTELNSMGSSQFEELEDDGLPVIGFTTTAQSKAPLIEGLALALEKEELLILNDGVTKGELEVFERKVNPLTYRSSYSAPLNLHDDTVMSLALAWHGKELSKGLEFKSLPTQFSDYRG